MGEQHGISQQPGITFTLKPHLAYKRLPVLHGASCASTNTFQHRNQYDRSISNYFLQNNLHSNLL